MPQGGACSPAGHRADGGLLGRLAPTVARLRNRFNTAFGTKAYDVYLVWTRWGGSERGEGDEHPILQLELLPTPVVEDLASVAFQGTTGGILPVGSVRLTQVTPMITANVLEGNNPPDLRYLDMADRCGRPARVYGQPAVPASLAGLTPIEAARANAGLSPYASNRIPDRVSFFYEIVERNAPGARRQRFRLSSTPFRRKGQFDWTLVLERESEDRTRGGESKIGRDPLNDF